MLYCFLSHRVWCQLWLWAHCSVHRIFRSGCETLLLRMSLDSLWHLKFTNWPLHRFYYWTLFRDKWFLPVLINFWGWYWIYWVLYWYHIVFLLVCCYQNRNMLISYNLHKAAYLICQLLHCLFFKPLFPLTTFLTNSHICHLHSL